jgi:hypothetical protein
MPLQALNWNKDRFINEMENPSTYTTSVLKDSTLRPIARLQKLEQECRHEQATVQMAAKSGNHSDPDFHNNLWMGRQQLSDSLTRDQEDLLLRLRHETRHAHVHAYVRASQI